MRKKQIIAVTLDPGYLSLACHLTAVLNNLEVELANFSHGPATICQFTRAQTAMRVKTARICHCKDPHFASS